jgi:hypothetical protein
MQYEKIQDEVRLGFRLSDKPNGTDTVVQEFFIRDSFSTWQLGKMTIIVGGVFKDCSESAQDIFAVLMSLMKLRSNILTPVNGEIDTEQVFRELKQQVQSKQSKDLALGFGELMVYLGENEVFEKMIATLYLKVGEGRLSKEEFTQRVSTFGIVPVSIVMEAVARFFMRGTKSSVPIGSLSKMYARMKSESETVISSPEVTVSIGTTE